MHRSPDTAHALWLLMLFQRYPIRDVMSHNSRTGKRMIFKLRDIARDLSCMTTDQGQKVKDQGHKVT